MINRDIITGINTILQAYDIRGSIGKLFLVEEVLFRLHSHTFLLSEDKVVEQINRYAEKYCRRGYYEKQGNIYVTPVGIIADEIITALEKEGTVEKEVRG